jgi:hypothetical protein
MAVTMSMKSTSQTPFNQIPKKESYSADEGDETIWDFLLTLYPTDSFHDCHCLNLLHPWSESNSRQIGEVPIR